IPTDDPEGAALLPDRDAYYADLPRGTVVFTGDLTLAVGDHTIRCLWTPGHTPGQLAVHVPEEQAVFTGDTIFSGCQTWLMTSNVDQWLEALERIRALDVDYVVPGHGPVVDLKYIETQRAPLMTSSAPPSGRGRRLLPMRLPGDCLATRPSPASGSTTSSVPSTWGRPT